MKQLPMTPIARVAMAYALLAWLGVSGFETLEMASFQSVACAQQVSMTWHTAYHPFADEVAFMAQLAAAYPTLVHYRSSIGKSVEGRDIPVLQISNFGSTAPKKQVVILAGLHGREWISIASAIYIAHRLASDYGGTKRVSNLLGSVQINVIPMSNPDGYVYTWATDRLWRKSRAKVNGVATGVDLDSNWPDHWGRGGSSSSPSSDTYKGPSAGSEPETQAAMAYIKSLAGLMLMVDLHSYGEEILRPTGWTETNTADDAALTAAGAAAKSAITPILGNVYTNERIIDIYVASGNAVDWFYGSSALFGMPRPMAFQVDLPPSEDEVYGFVLGPDQIVPIGKEALECVETLSEQALAHPLSAVH